jgi:HK97 family phage portal protein
MNLNDITTSIRSWFSGTGVGYYSAPYGNSISSTFISPATALTLTPVWRAVNLIANDVARTPAEWGNPNLETLYARPNQHQSGYDFRRMMTLQCLLYGNAFALINRRKSGGVYEIIPLTVGSVSLTVTNGTPVYKTLEYGDVAIQDMLHLKASILDGLWANSPINICRTAITTGIQQEDNAASLAQTAPTIALIHPSNVNAAAKQAIAEQYSRNHTGAGAGGKPLVLGENLKVQEISSASNQEGLEIARKYSISDVSRIFGVPSSYLSETSGSVYGSLEFLTRMYLDACLSHWFAAWNSEFGMKLGEECLFDTDFIARPSLAETYAAIRTGIESGVLTKNEARAILDYDPVDGGDEFSQALNLGTGGGQTNLGTDTNQIAPNK